MAAKLRAVRNRTLTLSAEERSRLIASLPAAAAPLSAPEVTGRIFCGDLMTAVDFLPPQFVDLLFLDPPYNLTRDFGNVKFNRRGDDAYLDYVESWFPRLLRLLKPTASVYLCGDWRTAAALSTVLRQHLKLRNRITWQREKGRGAEHNWKNGCEDIWFATVGDDYYFDVNAVKIKRRVIAPYRENGVPKDWEDTADGKFRLTCPANFWDDISVPYWSMPENTDHPTQKPEKLLAKIILASCPPGGMVFDPFLGSGTTAVVARKLGREFSGVEINPEYACWALKRLENAACDNRIQGYCNGVFWERNAKLNSPSLSRRPSR